MLRLNGWENFEANKQFLRSRIKAEQQKERLKQKKEKELEQATTEPEAPAPEPEEAEPLEAPAFVMRMQIIGGRECRKTGFISPTVQPQSAVEGATLAYRQGGECK